MKRIILILLGLLFLTGCASRDPAQSPGSTPTEPSVSPLLDAEAPLYSLTGGAVETYRIPDMSCDALLPMGSGLLVIESGDTSQLAFLSGEALHIRAQTELDGFFSAAELLFADESGLAYFDDAVKSIIFLDTQLTETGRLQLPADTVGLPGISDDRNAVYYCTGAGIHILDRTTGISRLLKETNVQAHAGITDVLFDSTLLRWESIRSDGSRSSTIVSSQTGQTLYSSELLSGLVSEDDHFFLPIPSGTVTQLVFGSYGTDGLSVLWPGQAFEDYLPLPERGALITAQADETGCALHYYDLTSGKRTASLTLPGIAQIHDLHADSSGDLWFCSSDDASGASILHRWDISLSETGDEAVYTAPYYPRSAPDSEGLARLNEKLSMLESDLGIDILLGEDALTFQASTVSLETEYLVPVYEACLSRLETALRQFPAEFYSHIAGPASDGRLRILLVRSLTDNQDAHHPGTDSGTQYWYDGNACIALALTESMEQTLYHSLGHLTDSRVTTVSNFFDDWEDLNPKGFSYDNSYLANQNRQDWQYLQDDTRSFADMFSMSFAREDRARIFEYAVMPDSGAIFRSQTMQRKLQTLCDGIRKAFNLEKDSTPIWEQYLNQA